MKAEFYEIVELISIDKSRAVIRESMGTSIWKKISNVNCYEKLGGAIDGSTRRIVEG